jgi:hypothetical protein
MGSGSVWDLQPERVEPLQNLEQLRPVQQGRSMEYRIELDRAWGSIQKTN